MTRSGFIQQSGALGAYMITLNGCNLFGTKEAVIPPGPDGVLLQKPEPKEHVFAYISRVKGKFDNTLYKQILGAANAFKEGDRTLNIAAIDNTSRTHARALLGNTKLADLNRNPVFKDELLELIHQSTRHNPELESWTLQELKTFTLSQPEEKIKEIMPCLSSDVIACLVKLMNNEE
ncbi:MAG: ethanolamine ammonia-lyase subunit EutB, partial [Eudoraea sp.]|nr:ethanolamine ammonia-lyase subunit EutB [Eudoraea sp.]